MRFIMEVLTLLGVFLLAGFATAWTANWLNEQEDHVLLLTREWTCTDYEPGHVCVEYRMREKQ